MSSSQRVMFFLLYGDYILNSSDFIVFQSSQVLQIRPGFIANRKYISIFSSQASRYSLKTFMSYKVFFFVFSFSSFSLNSLTSSSLMDANLLAMLLFQTTNATRETNSTKAKGGNRDVIERYDTHKGDILKMCHSGPG